MSPILSVKNVVKVYGKGCPTCVNGIEEELKENRCPSCGSIIGVNRVSLDLYPNEVLGIVGESGSGKSTLVKTLYFDMEPTSGEMYLNLHRSQLPKEVSELHFLDEIEDVNLFETSTFIRRQVRNFLKGMVYQHPHLGLKMDVSAGGNIAEKLLMAGNRNVSTMRNRALDLLEKTEVDTRRIDDVPAQFSGGMQQRVQIAKALSNRPILLYLDEVTTGLDVSVQAKVLDLIRSLQRELHVAMIIVSHDLGVIRLLTNRAIVMKNATVVEAGLTDQILENPQHAYTQLLVNSALN